MQDTAVSQKASSVVIPGYRLVQLVGQGGMGEVHQATQLSLGRTVAVKLLKPELSKEPQFIARFEKEAAALAQLRHPNIVSIVDRGRADDTYFLVMEYVDGPSLRERLRDPAFDATQALLTLVLVTRAIEYAHGKGVVHRDLKPENILFDEQAGGIPKVTDFGLAGLDDALGAPKNVTQTHVAMGTASYMAPEQAVDAKSAGPRADLYSLGVMLYECLTGELPVGSFAPPSTRRQGLDKRLDGIVARCLKPAPEDRYPSATALLTELEQVAPTGFSFLRPSRETKAQRLWRQVRGVGRRIARAAAVTLVVAALAIVGAVFLRANAESQRQPAGVELMSDLGSRALLSAGGRFDKAERRATLGEGPDTLTVVAFGRQPSVAEGVIDYGAPSGGQRTGRAELDADVIGSGAEFSALVDTEASEASALEPLWRLFRGPRPEARSALMLLGETGRYVALVVPGGAGEPTLEWSLGPDKRGRLQAPLRLTSRGQRLALRMDPETGELFAVAGEGRDARVVGDGLWLGPYWRQLLGESPRFGVGCLDGRCVFRELRLQGLELPSGLSPPAFPAENLLAEPGEPEAAPTTKPEARPKPRPPAPKAPNPKRR
jgi:hypothetical protein